MNWQQYFQDIGFDYLQIMEIIDDDGWATYAIRIDGGYPPGGPQVGMLQTHQRNLKRLVAQAKKEAKK
jgi:hypothetical protein